MLKTRLILFDTRIIDLGEQLADPVETLLGLQLGGGTDIAAALAYAATCIRQPSRSLLVLISDFHEGGDAAALLQHTRRLAGSGVKLLGLAALDREAHPDYDHQRAQELAACGMAIGAMTPDHLADWVAKAIA
jgi:Mg-chelatase subunit ChlD